MPKLALPDLFAVVTIVAFAPGVGCSDSPYRIRQGVQDVDRHTAELQREASE